MENHLFPTKLHHHHLFKEGFSQWDSHGKTELFKMHSNFIRRILHLQSKLSSLGHLPRSASKNRDRLLYIYKNSISSALGGRKEGRKEDSPGQKQLGKVCGLEQEWLLHVEQEKGIMWGRGRISPRNHEETGIQRRRSIISKAIIALRWWGDKAAVASIIFGKTRERLGLMRQI